MTDFDTAFEKLQDRAQALVLPTEAFREVLNILTEAYRIGRAEGAVNAKEEVLSAVRSIDISIATYSPKA